MTDSTRKMIEEKAAELRLLFYKASIRELEVIEWKNLLPWQKNQWVPIAKHVIASELKARIETYQCVLPDLLLPAKDCVKERINQLTEQLKEIEGL